jgi:hypothetical protein
MPERENSQRDTIAYGRRVLITSHPHTPRGTERAIPNPSLLELRAAVFQDLGVLRQHEAD